jgi:hypothetical protein
VSERKQSNLTNMIIDLSDHSCVNQRSKSRIITMLMYKSEKEE